MPNRERIRHVVAVALAGALLSVSRGVEAQRPLRLTFLDVGEGDATLLRSPEGKVALVDAGREPGLADRLRSLGIERIDLLVASHADADHIGGMLDIVRRMPVGYFLDNGVPHDTRTYLALMREVRDRPDISYLRADPRTIELGRAEIRILPLPPKLGGTGDQNDASVGLVVSYGAFEAFLSGDSEADELSWWLAHDDVPDVTVLKAPHHGSENGFTPAFLRVAHPDVVVISVGPNGYGHPAPAALSAYTSVAREVYRTDRGGDITIQGYEDGHVEVRTGHPARTTKPGSTAESVGHARRAPAGTDEGAASATAGLHVGIFVFADAPGNDHQNLNGEYVTLTNRTDADVSIAGWTLCDLARHCFRFPPGAVLPAEGRVFLFTGSGRADATHFYMGRRHAVWNNDGDTAILTDAEGHVLGRYAYE